MASKDKPRHENKRKKKHTREETLEHKREERRTHKHELQILRKRVQRTGHAPGKPAE
jgi:hypothetical protein